VAPPPTSKPSRLLLALVLLIVALATWAFWPGTEHSVKLGLDLQGGTQVILQPKSVTEGAAITEEQLQQTVTIIRQRVDGLGVAEAEVTTQGTGTGAVIVVSVPGVNQDRVVELVQRTALLDFRPVYGAYNPAPVAAAPTASPSPSASGGSATASAVPAPSASPAASASASPAASASASPTTAATPAPAVTASPSASASATAAAPLIQAKENTPEFQKQIDALDCPLAGHLRAGWRRQVQP
jgi:preprotein translocase subunit SecD